MLHCKLLLHLWYTAHTHTGDVDVNSDGKIEYSEFREMMLGDTSHDSRASLAPTETS
jgi:hypothetical protein